jgi:hypothetical protein
MKTQISKASHGRAQFNEEYKQQALELWRKSGRSANKVAAELGISFRPLLFGTHLRILDLTPSLRSFRSPFSPSHQDNLALALWLTYQ